MTTAVLQDITPQQRLAQIVAEETDDGRRIVRFFVKVAEGELDSEDFKPNHRMDAAKELARYARELTQDGRTVIRMYNEDECPYFGLEFPKFTEEESDRIKEWAVDGLRRRFEMIWGAPTPSEDDP